MTTDYTVVTASMVDVFITSNIATFTSQKKFDKALTIASLKDKLEMITGGSAGYIKLSVTDKNNKPVCKLEDDHALLGSFPIDDGFTIHVEDNSKQTGEFENTAGVEKFELSKEEYSSKTDTVQAYLKRNKMGKYNEEEVANMQKEKEEQDRRDQTRIETCGLTVDARCQVSVPGQLQRRGTIKYVGKTEFQPGWWIGVQYDEPSGKNDGSVAGKRYFTCPAKYGGFVKPAHVEGGDFPEEDLDLSDGEM